MKVVFALLSLAVSAQALSLTDLVHHAKRHVDWDDIGVQPRLPAVGGPLNDLLNPVIILVNRIATAVGPLVDGVVYKGVLPGVIPIVEGSGIKFCNPNSPVELLVYDVIQFVNNQLHNDLSVPQIKAVCQKGKSRPPSPADRLRITGRKFEQSWFCGGYSAPEPPSPPSVPEPVVTVEGTTETTVTGGSEVEVTTGSSNTLEVTGEVKVEGEIEAGGEGSEGGGPGGKPGHPGGKPGHPGGKPGHPGGKPGHHGGEHEEHEHEHEGHEHGGSEHVPGGKDHEHKGGKHEGDKHEGGKHDGRDDDDGKEGHGSGRPNPGGPNRPAPGGRPGSPPGKPSSSTEGKAGRREG